MGETSRAGFGDGLLYWLTDGNFLTATPSNFLGTVDNQPLVIKTNNRERLRVDNIGNIGIGTANIEAPLTVMTGSLGSPAGSEYPMVSLGFLSSNYSRLGILARRVADGTDWTSTSIGLQMNVDVTERAGASLWLHANGNVGVGTSTPDAPLSVMGRELGNAVTAEVPLASLGFFSGGGNYSRLGMVAQRVTAGTGWVTTAIGLGMDVDQTRRAGANLWLHANGRVGIGTSNPEASLTVDGDNLGQVQGDELRLASLAFASSNYSRLGIYARRVADGDSWDSTAIGLGMDVDIATRVGASLWLHADECITVGTLDKQQPPAVAKLAVTVSSEAQNILCAVRGQFTAQNLPANWMGAGVLGVSTRDNAVGVFGTSVTDKPSIMGMNAGGTAIHGRAFIGTDANSITATGVLGEVSGSLAEAETLPVPKQWPWGGVGVFGRVGEGGGVCGYSSGRNDQSMGPAVSNAVEGRYTGHGGAAILGQADEIDGVGVYGVNDSGGYAGVFKGNVSVDGTVLATVKQFRIDHPLDPENKYLNHWSVESNEILNLYSGSVVTDDTCRAIVKLPDYLEALNHDFRYQLTPLGELAHATVETEMRDGSFGILTDRPNVRVSWQITGRRQDPYVLARAFDVEQEKSQSERGRYLHRRDPGDRSPRIGMVAGNLSQTLNQNGARWDFSALYRGLDDRNTT